MQSALKHQLLVLPIRWILMTRWGKEKCLRNRLDKRHFRGLRRRETNTFPMATPPETVILASWGDRRRDFFGDRFGLHQG
jgi:hypothetical protein